MIFDLDLLAEWYIATNPLLKAVIFGFDPGRLDQNGRRRSLRQQLLTGYPASRCVHPSAPLGGGGVSQASLDGLGP